MGSFSPATNPPSNFDGFVNTPEKIKAIEKEQRRLDIAAEVLKLAETQGFKEILVYIESEIKAHSKSADHFMEGMNPKLGEVAFYAGALSALNGIKVFFKECDRLVTTKAQANASQEVKPSE